TPADFDNPLVAGHLRGQTGGSGGAPRPVLLDVGRHEAILASGALALAAYDPNDAPKGLWCPPPPSIGAPSTALILAKLGRRLDKLFLTHPLDARGRLILWGTAIGIRVAGQRMPRPIL